MKFLFLMLLSVSLVLIGCEKRKSDFTEDDLNSIKKDFLDKIFLAEVEEGPFNMHYKMRTVFFSKELISLFGEINVYDSMPHGWKQYEGKTYVKTDGKFKEIKLSDLFISKSQKEFLRDYCEKCLKKDSLTYFGGEDFIKQRLDVEDIRTFVVDDRYLIIIFQPYVAVSSADGPYFVKIPYDHLDGQWDSGNILFSLLQKVVLSNDFISSLDK